MDEKSSALNIRQGWMNFCTRCVVFLLSMPFNEDLPLDYQVHV